MAPLIPPPKRDGRPRTVDVCEVLNAIFYVLSTGRQWQALPKDLPPKSTVWDYFSRWEWEGTIERIHHALYVAVREQAGTVRNFVWDRGDHGLTRSWKRMANCALAACHSLAGILHSLAVRFKTRNKSLSAASSCGEWPRIRTARRAVVMAAALRVR